MAGLHKQPQDKCRQIDWEKIAQEIKEALTTPVSPEELEAARERLKTRVWTRLDGSLIVMSRNPPPHH